MEQVTTKSWEDLLETVDEKLEEHKTVKIQGEPEKNLILFRGQSDANWKLETTLERHSNRRWSLHDYVELVYKCAQTIESFEETGIEIPSYQQLRSYLKQDYGKGFIHNLPFSEYLIFMRHHGFPSPLIDWTTTIYLASYFAFINKTDSEYSAIYAYIESTSGSKSAWTREGNINTPGPHVKTHKRHFLQKSRYTYATKYDEARGDHWFVNHEEIFERNNERQDILYKFLIPSSERKKVLNILDESYNINPFSLFQTTDSLVKTMGLKEIIL